MYTKFKQHLESTINEIREAGLYKNERVIDSPQDARIDVGGREPVAGKHRQQAMNAGLNQMDAGRFQRLQEA